MSNPKILDFNNYNKYPTDSNPTTDAQMQQYMGNQNALLKDIVAHVWQPQTAYTVNQWVFSGSMRAGTYAVVTTAGTTGTTEPSWTANGTSVTDGGVTWSIRSFATEYLSSNEAILKTNGVIKRDINTNALRLYGGTANGNPSYILLYGNEHASTPGQIYMATGKDENGKETTLRLYPNGDITWDNKDVITAKNIVVANAAISNVSIAANGTGTGTYTFGSAVTNTGLTPKAVIAHAYSNVNYYPIGVYNITDTNCVIKFRNLTGTAFNSTAYVRVFIYL